MRKPRELFNFIEKELKKRNITKAEFSRRINVTPAIFNMAEKRDSYFSLETLCSIAEELNISLDDLLKTKFSDKSIPDDIKIMEHMLSKIPLKDREMIYLNIKNYYERKPD